MKQIVCAVMLMSLLVVTGCQKRTGGVAVIDLDKVASAMGWLQDMQKNLQGADAELRNQLDGILKGSLKSIDEAKQQVAKDAKLTEDQITVLNSVKDPRELEALPLSKDQREKLMEAVNKANTAWQGALNQYQQLLQGRRAALIVGYRDRVRPIAQSVAAAKGMTVVLTTADNVLYFDTQQADITDAVIAELKKMPPAPPPVPTPAPAPAPAPATPAPSTTPPATPAK